MKKLAVSLVVLFLVASGTIVLADGVINPVSRGGGFIQPLDHGIGG